MRLGTNQKQMSDDISEHEHNDNLLLRIKSKMQQAQVGRISAITLVDAPTTFAALIWTHPIEHTICFELRYTLFFS